MEFRIADSFTAALGRLTRDEQKAAKTSVFDLQTNPEHPGLKWHRIGDSKDPSFWSCRAGRDIRIVVHKTAQSFLLAYVTTTTPTRGPSAAASRRIRRRAPSRWSRCASASRRWRRRGPCSSSSISATASTCSQACCRAREIIHQSFQVSDRRGAGGMCRSLFLDIQDKGTASFERQALKNYIFDDAFKMDIPSTAEICFIDLITV